MISINPTWGIFCSLEFLQSSTPELNVKKVNREAFGELSRAEASSVHGNKETQGSAGAMLASPGNDHLFPELHGNSSTLVFSSYLYFRMGICKTGYFLHFLFNYRVHSILFCISFRCTA